MAKSLGGKDYDALLAQVNQMRNIDKAVRAALSTMVAEQKERIFNNGRASDGSRIGRYSKGYQKLRRKKGKPANFVNLRFTDQMFFDYSLIILGRGTYGIGFKNQFNYDKSVWNEKRYKKEIFVETAQEAKLVDKTIQAYLDRID